jgi:hypothetical protein
MMKTLLAVAVIALFGNSVFAQDALRMTCDTAGIGSAKLTADAPTVAIVDVSTGIVGTGATATPYCLVKVLIPEAINIWVGLPMNGKWNGKLQSLGGGGYAGRITVPTDAILSGYVGVSTDTGHTGNDGSFGMLAPGRPNAALQVDFAYRSEHLMSVIGRQLTQAFYGKPPAYAYWNGCSTGGRQGLMMAQRFPEDYNGILAGAPAIHWDRFQAAQIWPQVVMLRDNAGVISSEKLTLATNAAVDACDAADGVVDNVIGDPRACRFNARALRCQNGSQGGSCLTESEASAINKIWEGPVVGGTRLWWGPRPGAPLSGLAGETPFPIAVAQPKYWMYYDQAWDWKVLDYSNYKEFFDLAVKRLGPVIATDNPDLSRFKSHGSKLILWHGWADELIMPDGTIDYYDAVTKKMGGGYPQTQTFARLFMAPGVAHCRGGEGPMPQGLFDAVVNWVEHGDAPSTILASRPLPGGATRTRPLCPYPQVAVWKGSGSTDDAANFVCKGSP